MNTTPLAIVIEDDPHQTEIFSQALKQAGYEVATCADGQQALELLIATPPHLVILDLHLPQLTGDKILQHMRQTDALAKTKVILATANPRMAEPLRNISDLVLIKPISFSQLKQLAMRLHPKHTSEDK